MTDKIFLLDRANGLFDRRAKPIAYRVTRGGCWECVSHAPCKKRRGGVGYFSIRVNKTAAPMHRWVYESRNGTIPNGMVVMHDCDNALCINPAHLKLGTSSQNVKEAWSRGLVDVVGSRCVTAKLTEEQVLRIYKMNEPVEFLMALYGVSRSTIQHIRMGINWRSVTGLQHPYGGWRKSRKSALKAA